MIKVLFVCTGNICRSTMAEFVFKQRLKNRGLSNKFYVESAGTSSEETGNDTHHGTKNILRFHGIEFTKRSARRINKDDIEFFDYIIYMDKYNLSSLQNRFGKNEKFYSMLSFVSSNKDVADPWYTGDFNTCYQDINEGISGLFMHLKQKNII